MIFHSADLNESYQDVISIFVFMESAQLKGFQQKNEKHKYSGVRKCTESGVRLLFVWECRSTSLCNLLK